MKLGFSRQSNRKAKEARKHPDRNAQFDDSTRSPAAQAQRRPVVSVDTKKKELMGKFKVTPELIIVPRATAARERARLRDKKFGKVVPYGVYDVTANTGFVSVGITSDTAELPCSPFVAGASAWESSAIQMPES